MTFPVAYSTKPLIYKNAGSLRYAAPMSPTRRSFMASSRLTPRAHSGLVAEAKIGVQVTGGSALRLLGDHEPIGERRRLGLRPRQTGAD